MCCEVDSLKASTPQIYHIVGSQGHRFRLFVKVRLQPYYIYFIYFFLFVLHCTVCTDFWDYIWYLFLIIQFAVDASYLHTILILYCVFMRELPIFYQPLSIYTCCFFYMVIISQYMTYARLNIISMPKTDCPGVGMIVRL